MNRSDAIAEVVHFAQEWRRTHTHPEDNTIHGLNLGHEREASLTVEALEALTEGAIWIHGAPGDPGRWITAADLAPQAKATASNNHDWFTALQSDLAAVLGMPGGTPVSDLLGRVKEARTGGHLWPSTWVWSAEKMPNGQPARGASVPDWVLADMRAQVHALYAPVVEALEEWKDERCTGDGEESGCCRECRTRSAIASLPTNEKEG